MYGVIQTVRVLLPVLVCKRGTLSDVWPDGPIRSMVMIQTLTALYLLRDVP